MAESIKLETAEKTAYQKRANFYIIRKLWVVIRGKPHDGKTVHNRLGMSRPRYERLINGDITRVSQDEIRRWHSIGIPTNVALGTVLIGIPMINYEMWKALFVARDNHNEENYKKLKCNIDRWLEEADTRRNDNEAFAAVCRFVRSTQITASSSEIEISHAYSYIAGITPDKMLEVGRKTLEDYISELKAQLKWAEAVHTIRVYSESRGSKSAKGSTSEE